MFYPLDMRLREMPLDSCIKGICSSCSRLLVEQYGQVHIQATVKRVKGQCGFGRLVRIDILATLGLAFYIPAGEPEIQALIVCNDGMKIIFVFFSH